MLPVASQAPQKQQALEQLARVSSGFSKFCPRLEVCKPPVCAFRVSLGLCCSGQGDVRGQQGLQSFPKVLELLAPQLGKMALTLFICIQNEIKIVFLYKKTKHLPVFSQPLQAGASFRCHGMRDH